MPQSETAAPPTTVELIRRAVAGLEEALDFAGTAPDDLPAPEATLASLRAWLAEHDLDHQPAAQPTPESEQTGLRWRYYMDQTPASRIVAVWAASDLEAQRKLHNGDFWHLAEWDEESSVWDECDPEDYGEEPVPDDMTEAEVSAAGDIELALIKRANPSTDVCVGCGGLGWHLVVRVAGHGERAFVERCTTCNRFPTDTFAQAAALAALHEGNTRGQAVCDGCYGLGWIIATVDGNPQQLRFERCAGCMRLPDHTTAEAVALAAIGDTHGD